MQLIHFFIYIYILCCVQVHPCITWIRYKQRKYHLLMQSSLLLYVSDSCHTWVGWQTTKASASVWAFPWNQRDNNLLFLTIYCWSYNQYPSAPCHPLQREMKWCLSGEQRLTWRGGRTLAVYSAPEGVHSDRQPQRESWCRGLWKSVGQHTDKALQRTHTNSTGHQLFQLAHRPYGNYSRITSWGNI